MRINHNLSSMATQGALFKVGRTLSKSIEKLSTGMRINTAADDAAGLGISENLRTQITGLGQSLKNTQDAISMLTIADGALNEQSDILQRMRELVVQAKNDTYTSTERSYMGTEFSHLRDELDRIAASTNFNGMSILAAPEMELGEGTKKYTTDLTGTVKKLNNARLIFGAGNEGDSVLGGTDNGSSTHFNMWIGANYSTNDSSNYVAGTATSGEAFQAGSDNALTIQFAQMDSNSLLSLNPGSPLYGNGSDVADGFGWSSSLGAGMDIQDAVIDLHTDGLLANGTVQDKLSYLLGIIDGGTNVADGIKAASLADAADTNSSISGLDRINRMRSYIGGMVNRLEHSVNNSLNQIASQQSAESLIRDTDFAQETATFTKNQILTQSATSMLAQANANPQAVLSLLG